MKRQITITDAIPSIAESIPNPSSATDPAISAAVIATTPSTVIQAKLSHDSAFARADQPVALPVRWERVAAAGPGIVGSSTSVLMSLALLRRGERPAGPRRSVRE